MIVFDLACEKGHCFEGWFEDSQDLDGQLGKGLVACPVCGETTVGRVPSTFGIMSRPRGGDGGPPPGELERVFFKKVADYVEKNFENVGSGFATEALKMHYGVSEPRNIRGTSTQEEEKLLSDEGVTFSKFPMPVSDETDS